MASVPERIQFTLSRLDVRRADRVLEVGCGTGVLADLIANGAPEGRYVGIDRSATAVSATRRRLATLASEVEAEVIQSSLADLEPAQTGEFSKAVAVNVNLFWTRSATAELDILRRSLATDGFLLLVYQAAGAPERLLDPLVANLDGAGYEHDEEFVDGETTRLLAVECRPAALPGRKVTTT